MDPTTDGHENEYRNCHEINDLDYRTEPKIVYSSPTKKPH